MHVGLSVYVHCLICPVAIFDVRKSRLFYVSFAVVTFLICPVANFDVRKSRLLYVSFVVVFWCSLCVFLLRTSVEICIF